MKRHIDQLRQKADPSPKSTSQPTDNYFHQYEPDTRTPDADPIPPIPRQENQEPVYRASLPSSTASSPG